MSMGRNKAKKAVKSNTYTKAALMDLIETTSTNGASVVNPGLTKAQVVEILRKSIATFDEGEINVWRTDWDGHRKPNNYFFIVSNVLRECG